MLYKFKSKAGSDVIMLAQNADQVLVAMGRQSATQGIVEVADLPQAIQALEQALAQEAAATEQAKTDAKREGQIVQMGTDAVSLYQRAWPLLTLMKQAISEGQVITWGD
jgi:uncharacterized protein YoxC